MSAAQRGAGKKYFLSVEHLEFLSALSRIPFAPSLLQLPLVRLAISFQALAPHNREAIFFADEDYLAYRHSLQQGAQGIKGVGIKGGN